MHITKKIKKNKNKWNFKLSNETEYTLYVNDLIDYIDNLGTIYLDNYIFYGLENAEYNYNKNKHIVFFDLYECGNKTIYNYMDYNIREYCTYLANELWYFQNKNIYFNIINGKIIIFI